MNRSSDLVRFRAALMGAIGGLGLMVVGVFVIAPMSSEVPQYGALGALLLFIGIIFFYGFLLRAVKE